MEKIPLHLKGDLMNNSGLRFKEENTRSGSTYTKGKSTIAQILNNFGPGLIKLYLLSPIYKFVSQKPQDT